LASSYRRRSPHDRQPLHRRAAALALALGLNLLVLIALLGIQASKRVPKSLTDRLVVDLVPNSPSAETSRREPTDTKPREKRTAQLDPPRAAQVRPPSPLETPTERPLDMIELTRAEYLAADIGKLPRAAVEPGRGRGDSEEVGRGPNGQILYAAEWARRPTDTELGGYLPRNAPDGWGMVACRTVAGHRVEDCVELGNHPRGSRLASAVRQAAWQFRVRPPRRNGRELVGEWVRIRIDYIRR
jgi:periplasmic protein TonB